MELYQQTEAIKLIGTLVKTFPMGIKEAFDQLYETFGGNRAYYGVSWMDDKGGIIYYAMAPALSDTEEQLTGYEKFTIPKGNYRAETVKDWMSKTDSIKDVFHRLTVGIKPNENHPCIEWYQSDEEMHCMVKVD